MLGAHAVPERVMPYYGMPYSFDENPMFKPLCDRTLQVRIQQHIGGNLQTGCRFFLDQCDKSDPTARNHYIMATGWFEDSPVTVTIPLPNDIVDVLRANIANPDWGM